MNNVKAFVRGVPATVYSYETDARGVMFAMCKFSFYDVLLPVIAELIELRCEE